MFSFEITRCPLIRAAVVLSMTALCTLEVAAQGPPDHAPKDRMERFQALQQQITRQAANLPPNERQAWLLLLRMARADMTQPYMAREIRQFTQGKETEQWIRSDPQRGIRIEGIRPDNKVILDTKDQAFILEPKERRWFARPSAVPMFRGIFRDALRRLEKGELKATLDGQDTVSGRPCAIVRVAPSDGNTGPSHRFWIDKGTGLRMKMEIVGQDGRIFSTSYLIGVDFSPRFRPDDFTPPATFTPSERRDDCQSFRTLAEAAQAKADVPEPRYVPNGYTLEKIEVFGPETRKPRITLRYTNGLSVISLTQFKVEQVPPRLKDRISHDAPGFLPNPRGNGDRAYAWQNGNNVFILFSALPDDEVRRIADQVKP